MSLKTIQQYMTNNDCYKSGRKIKVKGLMLHSTAAPGVMGAAWFSRWNKPGIEKCVHGFIDDKGLYQYLPWDHRGWHAGGSANNTHIGIELCEPKNLNDKMYFEKVWNNAVESFAMLCKMFKLTEKDIIGHYEGHKLDIASNHADPGHWFPKHGKNMDMFRSEVAKKLKGVEADMLEKAIVINSFADFPNAEMLANRIGAPIFTRPVAEGKKVAKELYVCGGSKDKLVADKFTLLSGVDRYDTAAKIKAYMKS